MTKKKKRKKQKKNKSECNRSQGTLTVQEAI